jgi:hypothetical protein
VDARAQPASSFQLSCQNIRVTASAFTPPTLYAECRRVDGSLNQTSILIRGITNLNGHLYFTGMDQASSFQGSRINISVDNRIGVPGNTLVADCRREDGGFNFTSILIPGIGNNNGILVYQ